MDFLTLPTMFFNLSLIYLTSLSFTSVCCVMSLNPSSKSWIHFLAVSSHWNSSLSSSFQWLYFSPLEILLSLFTISSDNLLPFSGTRNHLFHSFSHCSFICPTNVDWVLRSSAASQGSKCRDVKRCTLYLLRASFPPFVWIVNITS